MAKIMRKGTKKNNVTLREKPLTNGNISLYLDIYREGMRVKEYLKLYIVDKPKNTFEREQNKETLRLAEEIRTMRESELNHSAFGLVSPVKKRVNFLKYFENYIDSYTKRDIRMLEASLRRFKDFLSESYPTLAKNIKPEQIDKKMMKSFVEYLQSKSVGEGAKSYFQRFKKVIKHATDEEVFLRNPCEGVVCRADTKSLTKDILTIEEIQLLAKTPYQNEEVRRAFLFCLYAGLRFCDVKDLKYINVDYSAKRIRFEQSKTKGNSSSSIVIIPLSNTLLSLIGDKPKKSDEKIFDLPSHTGCLKALRTWVQRAGIDKHITWHCARHSFAVNLLGTYQTDIKTVASLLGHSGLQHTEKYTRAVDSLKEKAVNSLPDLQLD